MTDLFDPSIPSNNDIFLRLRDDSRFAHKRQYCEEMWRDFAPYADPNFPREFADQLHPRFWEMYLGVQLITRGFGLISGKTEGGPDFHFKLNDQDVWVEATAPDEGEGPDAVPSLEEHNSYTPIPEDRIILRFTNSIWEKKQKLAQYIADGLVSSTDPYIVAINGRGIDMLAFDDPLAAVVKSVYPIGGYAVTIDTNSGEAISEGYQPRYEIVKESGAGVPTSAFLDPESSGVSGILYSNAALWNLPDKPGEEFLYIHNHAADVGLDLGWFGSGKDYYVEDDQLAMKRVT